MSLLDGFGSTLSQVPKARWTIFIRANANVNYTEEKKETEMRRYFQPQISLPP